MQPDLACFAKAIGGGTPIGAFGGAADDHGRHRARRRAAGHVQRQPAGGRRRPGGAHRGAHARRLRAPRARSAPGWPTAARKAIAEHGIPAHTVDLGAKGCVSYRPEPLHNYRDFLETRAELYDASYPWIVNRGVFMTPGDEEQWTISVQHTEDDIDRYVDAFAELRRRGERLTVPFGVVNPRISRSATPKPGDRLTDRGGRRRGGPGRREGATHRRRLRNGMGGEPEVGERGRVLIARHPRAGARAEPRGQRDPGAVASRGVGDARRSGRSAAGGRR